MKCLGLRDLRGALGANGANTADKVRNVHKEPELDQLGDTDALYWEAEHRVGELSLEIKSRFRNVSILMPVVY